MKRKTKVALSVILLLLVAGLVLAQGRKRRGRQPATPPGQGQGMGMGGEGRRDMQAIHALFADHQKITRTIKNIENGVEALTETDDPQVRKILVEHVLAMKERLEKKQPIRQWDPLFAALFQHADKINLQVVQTEKGVKIVETSTDSYVVKLIQAHASGVSEFVREGEKVMHKRHDLPGAANAGQTFLGKGDGVKTCPVTGEPVDKNVKAEINGRNVYFCCPACLDEAKKNPARYLKP